MKIGDKVRIIETGKVGIIIGETFDRWKIDFLDGDQPLAVLKTIAMEIVVDPVSPHPNPGMRPNKRKPWGLYAILFLFACAVVAAFIFL